MLAVGPARRAAAGGKDNFAIDREAGDQVASAHPGIIEVARASRACLERMVSYLTAEALLTSDPRGACGYIDCDVRDPSRILERASEILDFRQPIAMIMFGIMGNVINDGRATAIVLSSSLAPFSFLARPEP